MMPGSSWSCVLYFILLFLNLHSLNATAMFRQKRFSAGQVCNETNADLVIVNSCPNNTISFEKRSNEKQCKTKPNCLGEPLVYHCVKSKDNLVEVCAPSSPIIRSCCAVFERGVLRVVEDYSRQCIDCPFKYQSPDCFRYDTCVKTKKTYHTTQLIYLEKTSTSFSNDEGSKHNVHDRIKHSSPKINTIVLATTAATAIALGCLVVLICYRRHKKGLIMKEKQNGSAYDKRCSEGVNNQPLIENGNETKNYTLVDL
nr:uncharacterized protein LOC117686040 [Crassostrea gigas]